MTPCAPAGDSVSGLAPVAWPPSCRPPTWHAAPGGRGDRHRPDPGSDRPTCRRESGWGPCSRPWHPPWKGARAGSWRGPSRRIAGGSGPWPPCTGRFQPVARKGIVAVKEISCVATWVHPGSQGSELARGICRYDHLELDRLRGVHSDQIEQGIGLRLWGRGHPPDDMVLL